jgi:hypothetical protein
MNFEKPKSMIRILPLVFFVLPFLSFGQLEHCGFDLYLQRQEAQNPGFKDQYLSFWNHAQPSASENNRNTVYEIPVVFHMVYNTDDQNLSDDVFLSQLEIINADFRRTNANAVNTREIFLPLAADAEIEFVLATVDPQGNPTTGINHVQTDREGFELNIFSVENTLDEVKFSASGGLDAWDTQRYVNIWVCNILDTGFGQLFGLAYPPTGAPTFAGLIDTVEDDVAGIVLHYTVVGDNNPSADDDGIVFNNNGRTLTHEMGHYLGLRHIWGDGFFNGCNADDGISDTPNQDQASNYNCNFANNTCTDAADDMPDMVENYMDYNEDDCYNMFTVEQVAMMRFCLEELRPELIEGQFVGVNDQHVSTISIFPNPANDMVSTVCKAQMVEVLDAHGRLLKRQAHGGGKLSINVAELPVGFYLLSLQGESKIGKFVIQR